MASTRDIRRRIRSVKSTAQITKAMQMVAASKMRKAQEAALRSRPAAELLDAMIQSALERVEIEAHPLLARRDANRGAVLLITTDKGLCGGLNTNVLRAAAAYPPDTQFITIGRKGRATLARLRRNLIADFEVSDAFDYRDARRVGGMLMNAFIDERFDWVDVLFTRFINTISQRPEAVRLLPLSHEGFRIRPLAIGGASSAPAAPPRAIGREFKFEPDTATVLSHLLPQAVNLEIWHYLLEAKASEHSARMVAMKNATDNAQQIVKDLTLEYNKARQAAITGELLEISSAAAAME